MELLYKQYVNEGFDENGVLNSFEIKEPKRFNFAHDVVEKLAKEQPDRRAMLWIGADGKERTFSFADIDKGANRVANVFKDAGIKKGDMVMLVLKRHYHFWFCMMALCKLGAVAIPATNLLTKKDFVYRFNSAGVKAIVCTADGEVAQHAEDAAKECDSVKLKYIVRGDMEGWQNLDRLCESASDEFEPLTGDEAPKNEDPMLMYFTSGTTGNPKMVWHNFLYPLGHIITARHWHCVVPDGLHFTVADTGWGKAVWGKLYGQWLCEAGVFTYDFDKFVPTEILSMIEKYRITTFCAPPTIYRFLIHEDIDAYDLSSLRHTTIAGEALNPEVFNSFYKHTGLKLMEGFGQTETTLTVLTLQNMEPKPGSMGKPSPAYNTDIVTPDGKRTKDGEVGEIVIRLPDGKRPCGMCGGYLNDPQRNSEAFRDGLYHTGDTAWRDEDGYFWYVGRTDDIIKSSGYRIGPFEIESVLMEHPAVLECAVTGAPDEIRGQVVKASVVLTKGYTPSEELKKELQVHVKNLTAPYKYPRIVEFLDELPKTISGKIRRVELKEKDNRK